MKHLRLICLFATLAIVSGCGSQTPTTFETIKADGLKWNAGEAPLMNYENAAVFCAENGMQLREQNALLLNLLKHEELQNPKGSYWTSGTSFLDSDEAYIVTITEDSVMVTLTKKDEEHYVRCFKK